MAAAAVKRYDSDDERARHQKLLAWFRQELQRQAANRFQMAKDEDYYDSLQYTDEEAKTLLARGQMPVAWNEAKPTIDWLIGTERRARTDYTVVARDDDSEGAEKEAKVKTKLLKFIDDTNRSGFERSESFDGAVKGGLGWMEVGVRTGAEDVTRGSADDIEIYKRHESWRSILFDSLGPRKDLEDARYLFRFRFVDLDVAIALVPSKRAQLEAAALPADEQSYLNWFMGKPVTEMGSIEPLLPERWTFYDSSAWLSNPRQRVMLIECWHKEPEATPRGMKMRMRLTIMTEQDILLDDWSPYRHGRFPFIPQWCYRRKRDGAPYGVMRTLRGPQDAVNKAMSKAVWEASANGYMVEVGAIDPKVMDADELREELQAPNSFALLADGGLQKVKPIDRSNKIKEQMMIVAQGVANIRSAGAVTQENLGQESNADSGKAIAYKQEQGSITSTEIFDNALLARQLEGEITLSLAEQYMDTERVISIPGDRGRYEHTRINRRDPLSELIVENDITARAAKFVIGEQAWKQTLMQAMFESMLNLLGNMSKISPVAVNAMLADVLELADFMPNKRTMVANVRKALGQPDPDEPETPEQMMQRAMQQEIAQKQTQLALAQLEADVKAAIAKGEQLDASALQQRVRAMYEAMQAAQVVAAMPTVAPIADIVLAGSGYKNMGGQDPNIPQPTVGVAGAQPALPAPVNPAPQNAAPPGPDLRPSALDGVARGVETVAADGADIAQ